MPVAALRSPGIAHLLKSKFGMTLSGSTIDFGDLKLYKSSAALDPK